MCFGGFPGASDAKESAFSAGDPALIPGSGRSPGAASATHSSLLAWEIPGGSMRSQRVGHNSATES